MKLVEETDSKILDTKKVSDKEAEEAFKTILTWMGVIIISKYLIIVLVI